MSKILIAEDGLIIAFHLQKLLEKNGFKVIANLTHGEEVVAHIKEHSPDIIILDIMLQGQMNGIDAAMEIRKFSDTPIIFMSALTDFQTIEEVQTISNTIKLNKPFEEEYLIEQVKKLLP
ncbi:response regulator [Fulvivirga lutimaris]|uniref:response regulator n=1 Tax=Fulvivirga lutimaris TaxID=1819566 RepID=UPI0012BBA4DD|nr:response regulator [Fulvivirga lutimaris]MTI39599.1 response regulator [Fulvivirga lutimaris]